MIHIGIIPDGNRRWAKHNKIEQYNIENVMTNIIKKIISNVEHHMFKNLNIIGEITFYLLTCDNLDRKDNTVRTISAILDRFSRLITDDMTKLFSVQFIGKLELLPKDLYDICETIKNKFDNNGRIKMNVAIAYDPITDIKQIVKNNPSRPIQSNIDLVIRTGGELRSSGFFPLHTLYSEWIYLPKFFPDFTIQDLDNCISEYLKRSRRFGK